MRSLSSVILLILLSSLVWAQSPHGLKLKADCSVCHQPADWSVDAASVKFSHDTTAFKLTGGHASADCIRCHKSLVFEQTDDNCFSCHTDVHRRTLSLDCSRCHTPESWIVKNTAALHQTSRFPLTGEHLRAECAGCHSNFGKLEFDVLGTACADCHMKEYLNTLSPNHTAAGFSTVCEDCHSITGTGWSGGNFIHDFFPLTGGHAVDNCFRCHTEGSSFTGISPECAGCHTGSYNSSSNPPHRALALPSDCQSCHTTAPGWAPAKFPLHDQYYPLTGAHNTIRENCAMCHSGNYVTTPVLCQGCHTGDYNRTQNPDHPAAGISTECAGCHNNTAWIPSSFNHTLTGFELTGQHALLGCSGCHKGTTAGLNSECISCHQTDYNAAPQHSALNYPLDCMMCHNTSGWSDVNFNHQNTSFPLLGAHTSVSCGSCHSSGFSGTSTVCYDCHKQDFDAAADPLHTGFPHECLTCHNQNAWQPADFNHDSQYFPIYSGKHNGEWNSCSDCHTNPSNYSVFSCIDCHEHNKQDTDNDHDEVTGYVYESSACYSCHPDGNSDIALPKTYRGIRRAE